jgi:hypothetical protein
MLIISCTKDNPKDPNVYIETPEALIGKWSWLYSSGGFAGTTVTPQSTGEIKMIEFDRDNNYRLYINDILIKETKYKVEKGKTITSQDSVPILQNTFGFRQSISFKTSDTLILFDECYDCFEHRFQRVK